MGDIEKRKEIEAEGEHEDNSSTWLSKAMAFLKVVAIVGCLYFFICSLEILSSAFRLIAGSATGELFSFADNPLVGLMVGVLGTVLVQSSSTFTSIIVAAVGSGAVSVENAVPMVMGANIGTSVTNTLVAMTQIGNKHEFKRAFAAATVHDMFNWSTVIVLFMIEIVFNTHFLLKLSDILADALIGQHSDGNENLEIELFKAIVDPFTDKIIKLNKSVLNEWAVGGCEDCRLLKVYCDKDELGNVVESEQSECNFLFNLPELSDAAIGGILLAISLLVLCGALMAMVKLINSLLQGKLAHTMRRVVNPKFKSEITAYLYGYVNIVFGAIMTFILQSSSIFTSSLTPLVGIGLIEVDTVYPLFLGSNIGTTATSFIAALAGGSSGNILDFKHRLQTSFVHLFFNIIGIAIFYPIPFMRIPLPLCKMLGETTAKYRWFALVYILAMFFVLPGTLMGLSFIDDKNIALYVGVALIFAIVAFSTIVNSMHHHEKARQYLPEVLQDWEFLPKPLHSLGFYNRYVSKIPCCKKCTDVDDDEDVEIVETPDSKSRETDGIFNPAFSIKDETSAEKS